MASTAAHNLKLSQGQSSFNSAAYSSYCGQDGSFNSSSSGLGLNAIIPEINVPVGIAWNGSNTTEYMTAWCKQNQSSYASNTSSFSLVQTVDSGYYGGVNGCVAAVTNGSYIEPEFSPDNKVMVVSFHVGSTQFKNLGIVPTSNVTCSNPTGTPVKGQLPLLQAYFGDYKVTCSRQPVNVPGHPGRLQYNNSTIVVSGFPSGITVYWPHDATLSYDDAQVVQTTIDNLNGQLTLLQTKYAQVKDEANLAINVIKSAPFTIYNGSGACPAPYYHTVGPSMEGKPKTDVEFANAGFMVDDGNILVNAGWTIWHPLICQLNQDQVPQPQ